VSETDVSKSGVQQTGLKLKPQGLKMQATLAGIM